MNKVFNINLGGYPFTIDDDAYQHLSRYLKTIHNHFKHSEGYEEITSDIETRMAELFQDSLGLNSIVNLNIVEEAISIMGTPEEFGAEPMEGFGNFRAEEAPKSKSSKRSGNYKTGKRLFRDPDDQVLSGVCSGIAAYFGISDPLWVRIFFVIFTISGGFGIPAYIILWAILKEAKTSSDRLAMRGDDINVSNMAKVIEDEVEHITDKISEMTEGWESSGKKKSFASTGEFKQGIKNVIQLFGKGIRFALKILSAVIKPFIFIVGFALIIALAAIWLAAIISFFVGYPFLSFILPQNTLLGGVLIANLAIFIGAPIISLILLASRLLFKTNYNVRWKGGLIAFYVLNAICFFSIASYTASQFSMGAESHLNSERFTIEGDVLNINFDKNPYEEALLQIGPHGEIKAVDNQLVNETVYLTIEKSENDEFVLIKEAKSRGRGLGEAKSLAKNIRHNVNVNQNEVNISPYFLLNQGEKWRAQRVYLTLKVPEGKSIKFSNAARSTRYRIKSLDYYNGYHRSHWAKNGVAYKMQNEGLLGVSSNKEERGKQHFGSQYKDFSRIHIDGKIKIHIDRGDEFTTRLEGKNQYLNKVEFNQYGDLLKISTDLRKISRPAQLYITMPSLKELDIEHTGDVKLTGFKESEMTIRSESRSEIKAYVDVEDLQVRLDGRNELDIRGKGKKLTAYLNNRSTLDAKRFAVNVANIKAKDRCTAKVAVSDTLTQQIDRHSNIRVEGEPFVLNNK